MTTPVVITEAEFDKTVEDLYTQAVSALNTLGKSYDEKELRTTLSETIRYALDPDNYLAENDPRYRAELEKKEKAASLITDGTGLSVAAPALTEKDHDYFYNPKEFTEQVTWFIQGQRAGIVKGNGMIVGPSGQGKTESIIRLCADLNIPCYVMDMASNTTVERLIGHKEVDKDGTHYVVSEFLRWVEAKEYEPGVIVLDEFTRSHATIHNVLFPLMDGRKTVFIPDLHMNIMKHPQTVFLATANIGGRFTGTYNMDAAMRQRFSYTWEREFPPAENEVKVLVNRTGCPKDKAELMVQAAVLSRKKWSAGDLSEPISTRMLIAAAQFVAAGGSVQSAFELAVLPTYPTDGDASAERTIVRGILTGKNKEV
jgi:nitric oxide reductase NorQ protein